MDQQKQSSGFTSKEFEHPITKTWSELTVSEQTKYGSQDQYERLLIEQVQRLSQQINQPESVGSKT